MKKNTPKTSSLDWAISILGEKKKYTMVHVNKLIEHSFFTPDGLLTTKKAMHLVIKLSEHFGTAISQALLDKYLVLVEPVQEVISEVFQEVEVIEPETTPEPEHNEEVKPKGSDFIRIHHYELNKVTGTVIFYINTRCKEKRTQKFTGLLDNYDFENRVYNNLDRSFSKVK